MPYLPGNIMVLSPLYSMMFWVCRLKKYINPERLWTNVCFTHFSRFANFFVNNPV